MTIPATMRAAQYRSFSGPSALQIGTTPTPQPKKQQVLVKIAASSVNMIDIMEQKGQLKPLSGRKFPIGTGVDFSGTVVALGPRASGFSVGDRVWGYVGLVRPGPSLAAAEYLCVSTSCIAHAPDNIPLRDAAALPLAGLVALKTLRNSLRVSLFDDLLVIGGNGGVGSTAIQIGVALGANVDAVTGSDPTTSMQAGARQTFDYHTVSPNDLKPGSYSAILDTAGRNLLQYRKALRDNGKMVAVGPAVGSIVISTLLPGTSIRFVSAGPDVAALKWLAQAVDAGKLHPYISAVYPSSEVSQAYSDAISLPSAGKRIIDWQV